MTIDYGAMWNSPIAQKSLQEIGTIGRFVQESFSHQKLLENHCQRVALRLLQSMVLTIECLGTIPFIPLSIQWAGNNPVYATALVTGNVCSFTLLGSWPFLKMLQTLFSSKTHIEKECAKQTEPSSCLWTVLKIHACATGVIMQIPIAYMGYFYNKKSIPCGLIMLISGSGMPIYSLLLFLENMRAGRSLNAIERRLHHSKHYLIEALANNQEILTNLELEQSLKSLQKLSLENEKGQLTQIFSQLFHGIKHVDSLTESYFKKAGRYFSLCCGGVLASANLLFLATLGYHASALLTESEQIRYIIGSFIALCNSYLSFQGMTNTAVRTYNTILTRLNGSYRAPLSSRLKPRLYSGLWLLGFTLSTLAYGPAAQACHDHFSGNLQKSMEVLVPLGTILMVANAMEDLVDDIILFHTACWGTDEQKQLIELHLRLQQLSLFIKQSSILEYAHFLKLLPNPILQTCLSKIKLSETKLNQYLGKKDFVNTIGSL